MAITVLLLVALSVADSALTDADRSAALAAHNQVRGGVSPPALNMLALAWDVQLEASAAAYAATCPTGHSATPYGENLSWGWPIMNITDGVSAWAAEAQYYDLVNLVCAAGEVCGHYTQLVWASTDRLGCGHATCPGLFGHDQVQVYVCHYATAGNWAGTAPYAAGATQCGWCPVGYACNADKLCARIGTFTTAPTLSPPPTTTRRPRSTTLPPLLTTTPSPTTPGTPTPTTAPVTASPTTPGTPIPTTAPVTASPTSTTLPTTTPGTSDPATAADLLAAALSSALNSTDNNSTAPSPFVAVVISDPTTAPTPTPRPRRTITVV